MKSGHEGADRYEGRTDAELVRAAQAHDLNAFGELVRRNESRLYRFILRRLGLAAQAEEFAQDAFLRAWTQLHAFRGDSRFSTWVTGIALNVLREHWQRTPPESNDAQRSAPVPEAVSREHGPARNAERQALLIATQNSIDALPEELRETFVMHALDELEYEAIAALLVVPVGTVKSRISRARTRLRSALEDHDMAALTSHGDGS